MNLGVKNPKSNEAGGRRLEILRDPKLPITFRSDNKRLALNNQRIRRSKILATVRKLLVEYGLSGVTMRRIARDSGFALQTVYNLVGPRDEAIVEAISEYSRYTGVMALSNPEDPRSMLDVTDCWVRTIGSSADFCRQSCLIIFTPQRDIFYNFRDLQTKTMNALLNVQKRKEALKKDVDVKRLAEELILLSTALCIEWADRPFPIDQLRRRLHAGFSSLLSEAIQPDKEWILPAISRGR